MALRTSSEDIAEDVDVPVLVLAGACDQTMTIDEARNDAARFRNGKLVVCERSGHLPMLDEPERLRDALREWLRDSGQPS
jgi:pimeloyl-ACP methyl ester carboxylesterase